MSSPWFIRFKQNPSASIRLFCLHCAGGSASEFRNWPSHLPGHFELFAIQLPGREGRVREAFIAKMDDLIGGMVDAIAPFLDKPYAIFGHSFGALCAFEAIRELRRRGLRQPVLFVPAGRRPPHVEKKKPAIASLPREQFIEELRKDFGDHIRHVLDSVELQEVFIPQIHADFALSEAYSFRTEDPLDCPVTAFAGVDEDELENDELDAWALHTRRGFHSRRFPGDHFFVRESQRLVIDSMAQEINSIRRAPSFDLIR
ncbi:MAG: alpha/beta fold hydrolase [Pseudomonadota bacterium]